MTRYFKPNIALYTTLNLANKRLLLRSYVASSQEGRARRSKYHTWINCTPYPFLKSKKYSYLYKKIRTTSTVIANVAFRCPGESGCFLWHALQPCIHLYTRTFTHLYFLCHYKLELSDTKILTHTSVHTSYHVTTPGVINLSIQHPVIQQSSTHSWAVWEMVKRSNYLRFQGLNPFSFSISAKVSCPNPATTTFLDELGLLPCNPMFWYAPKMAVSWMQLLSTLPPPPTRLLLLLLENAEPSIMEAPLWMPFWMFRSCCCCCCFCFCFCFCGWWVVENFFFVVDVKVEVTCERTARMGGFIGLDFHWLRPFNSLSSRSVVTDTWVGSFLCTPSVFAA